MFTGGQSDIYKRPAWRRSTSMTVAAPVLSFMKQGPRVKFFTSEILPPPSTFLKVPVEVSDAWSEGVPLVGIIVPLPPGQ